MCVRATVGHRTTKDAVAKNNPYNGNMRSLSRTMGMREWWLAGKQCKSLQVIFILLI